MWFYWVLIGLIMSHAVFVLSQVEIGDIALGCPPASYRHGDYCYSQSVVVSTNFHDAQIACETFGGTLAIVRDEETQQFLKKLNVRKYRLDYWIGLTDHAKEGEWVFSDGSILGNGKNYWYPGEPNNHDKQEHCAYLWMLRGLKWNDDSCDKKHFYICQFDAFYCPETGNVFRQGSFCFLLSTQQKTFGQATSACEELGGMLAMDKDEVAHEALLTAIFTDRSWKEFSEENVSKLLEVSDGAKWMRSWIGITKSSQGRWQYVDGTSVDLRSRFWGSGEPGKESCVASARSWTTNYCRGERGYTCQYPANSAAAFMFDSRPAKTSASDSSGQVSLGQAAFVLLIICCLILGATVAVLVLKRQVLTRQVQKLRKNSRNDDDTSVTFTTLENSDVA